MSEYYDPDDDARPQHSPLLQPFNPKVTPSPSPSPIITSRSLPPVDSPPSARRRKLRRKPRPTQGDFVLIRVMDPNRPDIALSVGQRALRSEEGSDTDDDEMDDRSGTHDSNTAEAAAVQPVGSTGARAMDLRATAQKALDAPSVKYPALHRDSVVEIDSHVRGFFDARRPSAASASNGASVTADPSRLSSNGPSQTSLTSPTATRERHGSLTNGHPHRPSIATSPSPNLSHLAIPQPSQILPALQPPPSPRRDPSSTSPNQQRLPSFRHLSEIASAASTTSPQDSSHRPTNGFSHSHRQSISSSTHSPTSVASVIQRAHSISSALSPGTPFPPPSATSPITPASETTAATPKSTIQDVFLRGPQLGGSLFGPRRASMASDAASPFPGGNASSHVTGGGGSVSDMAARYSNGAVKSPDAMSPGSASQTLPTPVEPAPNGSANALPIPPPGPRMSIDGAMVASRTLPRPGGAGAATATGHGGGGGGPLSIQTTTVPAQGSGYRCDYPGCNSAPFQTQYLLNSHANVHSQSRPHYCPVPGCSRAAGGKGFKRKNEMIRHGLVHDSPGYVCPFCNDREHRYPRPDNLQRHVRVHHVDKDKDDPALREVLAQRPEGGARGRRRRGG